MYREVGKTFFCQGLFIQSAFEGPYSSSEFVQSSKVDRVTNVTVTSVCYTMGWGGDYVQASLICTKLISLVVSRQSEMEKIRAVTLTCPVADDDLGENEEDHIKRPVGQTARLSHKPFENFHSSLLLSCCGCFKAFNSEVEGSPCLLYGIAT